MPVKTLPHPTHGTVRLGRKRPVPPLVPRLFFRDFLAVAAPLPGTPLVIDYRAKALTALSQINMNDTLGDCVEAGQFHVVGTWTGNASGTPFAPSNAQCEALYGVEGGYVPGNPSTDNGTDEQTAYQNWRTNGLLPDGSHKITGVLVVDPNNPVELRSAIWLFENLCFGLELPDAWVASIPGASGFIWDVAGPPDPSNGHFIVGVGCNAAGIQIDTWGMIGTLTYAAIAAYCSPAANGDVSVVISTDALNRAMNKAPNGLNWAQLQSMFSAAGGA